jgi:hypothetical protein
MSSRSRLALASMLVLSLLAAPAAPAYTLEEMLRGRLEPELQYLTRRTPHFLIHYPQGLERVASEVARTAEAAHDKVSAALQLSPAGPTHIVLAHRSDQPDTFTFVFPHRQIFLDISLPHLGMGLNDYADWYDWLLTHEYAHVVHLDATAGLSRPLSWLLGSWVRPNMSTPAWLKEGLAVHLESSLTPRGRASGSLYRMMARMAVAEGVLDSPDHASLDTMANHGRHRWPWGTRPYLYGSLFVHTLAGLAPDLLPRLVEETARSTPFLLDPALAAVDAGSLQALRTRALADIQARAHQELQQLAQEPFTGLQALTHSGFLHSGLTVSPDGRWLVTSRQEPDEDDALLRFPLQDDAVGPPEVITTRSTGYQASFSRSSRFLVFDQSHRARNSVVSDLYIHDLKTRAFVRISPGFRARDPDVHPDGKHLVFVSNEGGRNRLLQCNTNWEDVVELLGEPGGRRISAPRISPDGQSVVFMLHDERTGGEDLVLLGPEGARVLLADGAQNRTPTWSPDGQTLLFSSDRGGVFNVYALELASRRLHRLSHVPGGLFFPVVDPARRWVYAVSYSSRGYDVVRWRWAPETWTEVAELPDFVPLELPAPEPAEPPPAEPDRTYQGWRSLGPQYVLPSVLLRPDSFQLGARVGAVDPLFFQHYELALRYDSASRLPVGRFFYFDGRWPWALDVELAHDAVPLGQEGPLLRTFTGSAALSVPLGDEHSRTLLRPGLDAQVLASAMDAVLVGGRLELLHDTEFRQLGYSFFESGSRLRLGARGLWDVRAGLPAAQVDVLARTHLPLGWKRHVLHLQLEAAAFVLGRELPGAVLFAGGQSSFPFSLRSPVLLYGYEPYALASPQLAVATAHYTLPLADISRGLGGLPLFFGRTSAGLRLQAAAVDSLRPQRLPLSAGLELYQEFQVGDLFPLVAQLGLYQGVPGLGGSTQVLFSLSSNE